MKIAQICPRYSPDIGGVETHVKEISERLVRAGHDVEVITTDPSGKLEKRDTINGVKILRFRSFAPGNAYYFAPQIYFYLKKHNFDVIHAHSYHALPALFAALGKRGRRFVFTPHYHRSGHTAFRNLLHKPYRLFGKVIFSRSDSVICVSEYEKRLVEADFRVSGKTVKIPNGISFEEFEHLRTRQKVESVERKAGEEATGEKQIGKDKVGKEKILLYVGRLEEYKGVQYIIQSLPELKDFRLRVVGKGPYEEELRNMAKSMEVAERAEWLKNLSREELLECYADADIFLMLSSHEAYGITVAEALAAGIPCVVAKGSALEEFVDGENCAGIENPVTVEKVIDSLQKIEIFKREPVSGRLKGIMDWNEVSARIEKEYIKQSNKTNH
ncbi:LPS biosynthesis protein [Methanosarcina mazei]|uniref:LPS biosynthesis protein n=1 Tax=Methanosarcina mazei TaxID=2209 RepID=A0A0F8FY34_METMZ|nr:glycosyltransferase family 4 protein [Methanosarcina mazei]KKG28734.1 LPS biosynthesis protein [Methanosarcina mazei]KKG38683.1 LPS biosynthesis protein [Methanosarcina mazei]KKG42863.1 LPS biosynthesis protein [Methanosarcina mazei]KKG43039.1 LPS biosynthesis protein [Methanosarcina mazei]KKG47244.1 LPS biosynthesis protein [Methanosarcina mazei]